MGFPNQQGMNLLREFDTERREDCYWSRLFPQPPMPCLLKRVRPSQSLSSIQTVKLIDERRHATALTAVEIDAQMVA